MSIMRCGKSTAHVGTEQQTVSRLVQSSTSQKYGYRRLCYLAGCWEENDEAQKFLSQKKAVPSGCTTFCDTLKLSLLIHWDISRRKKKRNEKKKKASEWLRLRGSINHGWRKLLTAVYVTRWFVIQVHTCSSTVRKEKAKFVIQFRAGCLGKINKRRKSTRSRIDSKSNGLRDYRLKTWTDGWGGG